MLRLPTTRLRHLALGLSLGIGLSVWAGLSDVEAAEAADTPVASELETRFSGLFSEVAAPQLEAPVWALMEFSSGMIVASSNGEIAYPPASITKLMTNFVVYEALSAGQVSLSDRVTISERAWRAEGSRMFAKVGSQVVLEQLLKSTVIQSGNDAAIALAEHVAGSEARFAERMNSVAARLNLKQAYFINSTGLPAQGHTMSAVDIARLSAALIRDHPDFYAWYKEKNYRHNEITQYNRNKLLWKDPTVDGLKTGHTQEAGFCLVGSALREGQRWIAVVMGAVDERARERDVMALLEYGFANFSPTSVLDQQGGLTSVEVFGGEVDEVLLTPQRAINVVIPRGREAQLRTEYQLSPYFLAPIESGQPMGLATLMLGNQHLRDVPLVAMSTIEQGGWWKRLVDDVKLRLRNFSGADQQ